jgi:hypothetical protein
MGRILIEDDGNVFHRLGTKPFRHVDCPCLPTKVNLLLLLLLLILLLHVVAPVAVVGVGFLDATCRDEEELLCYAVGSVERARCYLEAR